MNTYLLIKTLYKLYDKHLLIQYIISKVIQRLHMEISKIFKLKGKEQ